MDSISPSLKYRAINQSQVKPLKQLTSNYLPISAFTASIPSMCKRQKLTASSQCRTSMLKAKYLSDCYLSSRLEKYTINMLCRVQLRIPCVK